MADELFNEEVFTLTDEEGNEKQFELLGSQEIDGNTFIGFQILYSPDANKLNSFITKLQEMADSQNQSFI